MSPLLDGDIKCSTEWVGNLKQTASTAFTISHASSQSSGYYSGPGATYLRNSGYISSLRLSTVDCFVDIDDFDQAEEDDSMEDDDVLYDDFSLEYSEMRRRSSSLPTTTRGSPGENPSIS
jgi:hypothetical protein